MKFRALTRIILCCAFASLICRAAMAAGMSNQGAGAPPQFIRIDAQYGYLSSAAIRDIDARKSQLPDAWLVDQLDDAIQGRSKSSLGNPPVMAVIDREQDFQGIIRLLNSTKGVDPFRGPSVTMRSGQSAVIEIPEQFTYSSAQGRTAVSPAALETRQLGLRLDVSASVGPDGQSINLKVNSQFAAFQGFLRADGRRVASDRQVDGSAPIFSLWATGEISGAVQSGGHLALGYVSPGPNPKLPANDKGVWLDFINARLVGAAGR
jgi:hypothetical protein